jgi:hypothetical protein
VISSQNNERKYPTKGHEQVYSKQKEMALIKVVLVVISVVFVRLFVLIIWKQIFLFSFAPKNEPNNF